MKKINLSNRSAFTIVELLVVIVVLGILAAIVISYLNPAEISAQARDSNRITDINNIKRAIDLFIVDKPDPSLLGVAQKVYISIPDTSSTCANISGLPTLSTGWTYNCVTSANLKNVNGTGWLPINLTASIGGSAITSLPIDPQNTSSLTKYYQYIPSAAGTYELATLVESEKIAKAEIKDGGIDSSRFEVGTDLTLWKAASGLVGYWNFDGNIGAITNGQATFPDLSGTGNNGVAVNTNGTGMAFVAGKVNTAIQFDGIDDKIEIPYSSSLDCTGGVTVAAWVKTNSAASSADIFSKYGLSGSGLSYMLVLGANISGKISFYNQGWRNGAATVNDNAWHYLVGTSNGTTWKVYFDGILDTSGSAASINISNSTASIGGPNSNNWGGYYSGLIDDVSVYNRTLTDSEVRSIYNASK